MSDIFLSYRREDGYLFAQLLYERLYSAGFSVFFDREGLAIGDNYPYALEEAICECYDFIAVCSESYLGLDKRGNRRILEDNDWVHREIYLALKYEKKIIPIMIDDAKVYTKIDFPEDISAFLDINFDHFSSESRLEIFLADISEKFSNKTRQNSQVHSLIESLRAAGDEADQDYNIKLREIVINFNATEIEELLFPLINNGEYDLSLRFSAYYSTFTYYRRNEHPTKIYNLVDMYSNYFSTYSFNNVVLSHYYKNKFMELDDQMNSIENAIKYAKKAVNQINGNSGVLHNYAELVAVALESGYTQFTSFLPDAIESMKKAMVMNVNYPKQYCTLGRLVSWTGEFEESLWNIRKAVDLENRDNKDSLMRVSQYYNHEIDIKIRQKHKELISYFEKRGDVTGRLLSTVAIVLSLLFIIIVLWRT